jgi:hypothetical protein
MPLACRYISPQPTFSFDIDYAFRQPMPPLRHDYAAANMPPPLPLFRFSRCHFDIAAPAMLFWFADSRFFAISELAAASAMPPFSPFSAAFMPLRFRLPVFAAAAARRFADYDFSIRHY